MSVTSACASGDVGDEAVDDQPVRDPADRGDDLRGGGLGHRQNVVGGRRLVRSTVADRDVVPVVGVQKVVAGAGGVLVAAVAPVLITELVEAPRASSPAGIPDVGQIAVGSGDDDRRLVVVGLVLDEGERVLDVQELQVHRTVDVVVVRVDREVVVPDGAEQEGLPQLHRPRIGGLEAERGGVVHRDVVRCRLIVRNPAADVRPVVSAGSLRGRQPLGRRRA